MKDILVLLNFLSRNARYLVSSGGICQPKLGSHASFCLWYIWVSLVQASFKLCWGCNGEKSGQHKHEIVSFERGNITTAERSSKQVQLLKFAFHSYTTHTMFYYMSFMLIVFIFLCFAVKLYNVIFNIFVAQLTILCVAIEIFVFFRYYWNGNLHHKLCLYWQNQTQSLSVLYVLKWSGVFAYTGSIIVYVVWKVYISLYVGILY